MPNIIAYMALLSWPFVCYALFKKLRIEKAIIWSILGGYLILPPVANFNLPLFPSMDKMSIPNISAFLICLYGITRWRSLFPESRIANLLILIFVLGAIPTVLTNLEPTRFFVLPNSTPIVYPSWQLPGLSVRDVMSALTLQAIILMPFLLGRKYLATETAIRSLLAALMGGILAYSVLCIFEARFSPQLNIMIYGFFQHDFSQTFRGNGYRPFVFLEHGLWLALLVLTALLATAALTRTADVNQRTKYGVATIYIFVVLSICKSLAIFAYGLVFVPLVFLASPRTLVKLALCLALIATVYPLLRGLGLIPMDDILALANKINPDRAASLAYRFTNETALLDRATDKSLLGWGGWGRNLIHDGETGELITIPDGRWIIAFGTYGWLGYISEFGLLALPIFLLGAETFRRKGEDIGLYAAVLALMVGINMFDLLLNATLTPLTWLMSGAVLGHTEMRRTARLAAEAADRQIGSGRSNRPVMGTYAPPQGPRTVM